MKNTFIEITLVIGLGLQLTACSAKSLDKSADTVDAAQAHVLVRDWKRVVRYDCQDQITSDRVETVRSPTEFVQIAPKVLEKIYSSSFNNLTNGSKANLITGYTDFQIDMAPTAFNMKVEEGINEIHYEFTYCDHPNTDNSQCLSVPEVRESGSLFINVTYQQNWLEGMDTIKPTYEDCHPQTPTTTTTTLPMN